MNTYSDTWIQTKLLIMPARKLSILYWEYFNYPKKWSKIPIVDLQCLVVVPMIIAILLSNSRIHLLLLLLTRLERVALMSDWAVSPEIMIFLINFQILRLHFQKKNFFFRISIFSETSWSLIEYNLWSQCCYHDPTCTKNMLNYLLDLELLSPHALFLFPFPSRFPLGSIHKPRGQLKREGAWGLANDILQNRPYLVKVSAKGKAGRGSKICPRGSYIPNDVCVIIPSVN